MTRLTQGIRDSIRMAVLRHRFTADVDAMRAREGALANDVYDDVLRKADRDRIEALPSGWLPLATNICVKFGDNGHGYTRLSFEGGCISSEYHRLRTVKKDEKPTSRRVPCKLDRGCWKSYSADHRLTIRFEKLKADADALEEVISTAERQIKAALNSVGTVAALVKAWPEIAPFTKRYLPVPVSLPTIPTADLNKALKLPAPEAA